VAKGTLIVNAKKQVRITFTNAKGNAVEMAVPDAELSAPLRSMRNDANRIEDLNGKAVDLDEEKGQPKRIRPVGEEWAVSTSPPAHPQAGPRVGQGARVPAVQGSTAPREPRQLPPRPLPAPAFHNPYNFVPAPPRKTSDPHLGDAEPVGHHRYFPERVSGRIAVKLTTVTPLLLPDAAQCTDYEADRPDLGIKRGHKGFPVRLGSDGRPYLPPTSVKGMLRSGFEAVTNSRLSVFEGWDRRLAFRRQAKVEVEPAWVRLAGDTLVEIHILSKTWQNSPAKLPRYLQRPQPGDKRKGEDQAALKYPDGSLPKHQDHVWVEVLDNGRVAKIRPHGTTRPGEHWLEGWVLITEPNINNKKAERVFVLSPGSDKIVHVRDDEARRLRALWSELIQDYQVTHEKDLADRGQREQEANDYLGPAPGQTAWSRHVYDRDARLLADGTLCYVRREQGGITGLYPVSISRDLFPVSPESLLPESLRPATSLASLSPADRVFGWVNQDGRGACRGHVRVGPVTCAPADAVKRFPNPGLPLSILGQPKPQQGRFYVAAGPSGAPQQSGQLTKFEAGHRPGKGLRGRKVYPHHRGLPDGHWANPEEDRTQEPANGHFQEYRRPRLKGKEERDTQNRSIEGWIKPATEFLFDLHVTNLTRVELGGLLWLLSLGEGYYNRLGGGKPLGFGSVQLSIDPRGTHLHTGTSWKSFYESLDEPAMEQIDPAALIASFKEAVAAAYGANTAGSLDDRFQGVPFIAAFLRAARGFEDGLPVHYPRARHAGQAGPVPPHPEGLAYEWFVENDRTGRDAGPAACLPDLANDPGLPMLDAGTLRRGPR